jgi:hypothetical protein
MTSTVGRKLIRVASHSSPATPRAVLAEQPGEHGADKGAKHGEDQRIEKAPARSDVAKEAPRREEHRR